MVLVRILFVHHSVEHGFEDLVESLNLAISLRIISKGILVFKLQHIRELFPYRILKVRTVV